MHYYYLKLGPSNSEAQDWINGKNQLSRPAVVIYFGETKVAELIAGTGQAADFCRAGLPKNHDQTIMIVIHSGKIWFLKPEGEVQELPTITDWNKTQSIPKAMPVRVLLEKDLKDVSPVLASIAASRRLGSGTFREIDNWGNIKAIEAALGRPIPPDQLKKENMGPAQLLECLSSTELETLVAKLFESKGCFVPAYRGGVLKDIDIFAHNDSNQEIALDSLRIPSKGSLSIQVKGWAELKRPDAVDCLIGLNPKPGDGSFDAGWLLNQVREEPKVCLWLKRSLSWLPQDFLSAYGI